MVEVQNVVRDLLASVHHEGEGRSHSPNAARAAFERLDAEGWLRVGLSEELGGNGGGLFDAVAVVTGVGASGHLLPAADILIGSAQLLEMASLPLPGTAPCVLPIGAAGRIDDSGVSVRAWRVPWARWASHFLVVVPDGPNSRLCLVDAAAAHIDPGHNVAGEPRDGVTMERVQLIDSRVIGLPLADCLARMQGAGALARSIQMATAIEQILHITVKYCTQRQQFGRAISAFQAVQQQLAQLAGESAACDAVVAYAVEALSRQWSHEPIAVAKARTGLASGTVARIAHQLHGAIGITDEYPLHAYTCGLWSWREEFGAEGEWAATIAADLSDAATDVWSALVSAE